MSYKGRAGPVFAVKGESLISSSPPMENPQGTCILLYPDCKNDPFVCKDIQKVEERFGIHDQVHSLQTRPCVVILSSISGIYLLDDL